MESDNVLRIDPSAMERGRRKFMAQCFECGRKAKQEKTSADNKQQKWIVCGDGC